MAMPNDLVLVRHGQSEGNVATDASKAGDESYYTPTFRETPGHQWRLTDKGRSQATTSGAWIAENIAREERRLGWWRCLLPYSWLRRDMNLSAFDTYMVSPYVRAQETAGHLNLPDARWRLNRALRERDWGTIGQLPRSEFLARPEFELNAAMRRNDPLYWPAPGGESIAQVAEDRVRNVLATLHRENEQQRVIAVCHGETMWAFRLVLERLSDAEFVALDADPGEQIRNGEVFHYTRRNPVSGALASRLTWVRRAWPELVDGQWKMRVTEWREITFRTYTNDDLLTHVAAVPSLHAWRTTT